jgi:hypothetical protein
MPIEYLPVFVLRVRCRREVRNNYSGSGFCFKMPMPNRGRRRELFRNVRDLIKSVV